MFAAGESAVVPLSVLLSPLIRRDVRAAGAVEIRCILCAFLQISRAASNRQRVIGEQYLSAAHTHGGQPVFAHQMTQAV